MCDIAREWLNKAKHSSNVYDRFISAYIALNFLYGGMPGKSECKRMIKCLNEICINHGINPFSFSIDEYYKLPIVDMRPDKNDKSQIAKKGNRVSLFKAIYQVRCNLFHGNKSLYDERDKRLVSQGSDVIIGILNKYFGIANE